MKKSDVIALHDAFEKVKNLGGVKFKYSILKNLKKIESEYNSLKEVQDDIYDNLKEYNEEVRQYVMEHGNKLEDGSVQMDVHDEDVMKKFNTKIDELKEKYSDNFKKFDEDASKYNSILLEDVESEIEWYSIIDISVIPDDLDADALEKFMDFGIVE